MRITDGKTRTSVKFELAKLIESYDRAKTDSGRIKQIKTIIKLLSPVVERSSDDNKAKKAAKKTSKNATKIKKENLSLKEQLEGIDINNLNATDKSVLSDTLRRLKSSKAPAQNRTSRGEY